MKRLIISFGMLTLILTGCTDNGTEVSESNNTSTIQKIETTVNEDISSAVKSDVSKTMISGTATAKSNISTTAMSPQTLQMETKFLTTTIRNSETSAANPIYEQTKLPSNSITIKPETTVVAQTSLMESTPKQNVIMTQKIVSTPEQETTKASELSITISKNGDIELPIIPIE